MELLKGRFSRMFSDPSFAIDTSSEAYKRVKPVLSKKDKELEDVFDVIDVEDNANHNNLDNISDDNYDNNNDNTNNNDDHENHYTHNNTANHQNGEDDNDEGEDDDIDNEDNDIGGPVDETERYLRQITEINESISKNQPKPHRKLKFFEAKETDKDTVIIAQKRTTNEQEKKRKMDSFSFERRVRQRTEEEKLSKSEKIEVIPFGPKTLTYIPHHDVQYL